MAAASPPPSAEPPACSSLPRERRGACKSGQGLALQQRWLAELVLDPRRHDPGLKTILGRREAFTGESLAGWLAEQPATARFISGRIWRQLVGTSPKPRRLEQLAAGWRQRQLSIPWLLAAIQATPEARDSRERGLRLGDGLRERLIGRYPSLRELDGRGDLISGISPPDLYRQVLRRLA